MSAGGGGPSKPYPTFLGRVRLNKPLPPPRLPRGKQLIFN